MPEKLIASRTLEFLVFSPNSVSISLKLPILRILAALQVDTNKEISIQSAEYIIIKSHGNQTKSQKWESKSASKVT